MINGYLAKYFKHIAGWSSLVARQADNLKVVGSNPIPATTLLLVYSKHRRMLKLWLAAIRGSNPQP